MGTEYLVNLLGEDKPIYLRQDVLDNLGELDDIQYEEYEYYIRSDKDIDLHYLPNYRLGITTNLSPLKKAKIRKLASQIRNDSNGRNSDGDIIATNSQQ